MILKIALYIYKKIKNKFHIISECRHIFGITNCINHS